MRKPSVLILSLLFITLALTAISWISAKGNSPKTTAVNEISTTTKTLTAAELFDNYIADVYQKAGLDKSKMDFQVFKKAIIGYYNLKNASLVSDNKAVITIVDFNKASTQKRLWIVDLEQNKVLFNTLVAHGRGSGDNMAQNFSNLENSHQSSLGFYITSDIYFGKHGLSMKLDGMDKGFNTNAKNRAVVVHGADYVSQEFINSHGRLGRSHGCPALPVALTKTIIENIKGKTCLYISGPANVNYATKFADQELAIANFINTTGTLTASASSSGNGTAAL